MKIFSIIFEIFFSIFLPSRNISFGFAQTILPGRNFARFILMLFILFNLIMRAAYQGKQFEFMGLEMRRPDVQSIDEMIEQNFTLHFLKSREIFFTEMEFMHR